MKSSILINDTRIDHHHGCMRVVAAIKYLTEKYGFPIKHYFPSHTTLCGTARYENALKECEVVLINGEGTLHHDRPAAFELLKAAAQAKSAGKYVVLLNAGWEENSIHLGKFLSVFDIVIARDKVSQLAMSAFDVSCQVLPDLSFYLPAPLSVSKTLTGRIAFSDSVLRNVTLELWKSARVLQAQMLSIQFLRDNQLVSKYKFVRDAIGRQDLNNLRLFLDLIACRWQLMKVSDRSTDNWLQTLGSYSLLVSGRFHACTLAMLMGVPFVALQSNTSKISNLINDSGLDSRRLLQTEDLRLFKVSDWNYSENEKFKLDHYILDGRQKTESLFQRIHQDLNQ